MAAVTQMKQMFAKYAKVSKQWQKLDKQQSALKNDAEALRKRLMGVAFMAKTKAKSETERDFWSSCEGEASSGLALSEDLTAASCAKNCERDYKAAMKVVADLAKEAQKRIADQKKAEKLAALTAKKEAAAAKVAAAKAKAAAAKGAKQDAALAAKAKQLAAKQTKAVGKGVKTTAKTTTAAPAKKPATKKPTAEGQGVNASPKSGKQVTLTEAIAKAPAKSEEPAGVNATSTTTVVKETAPGNTAAPSLQLPV